MQDEAALSQGQPDWGDLRLFLALARTGRLAAAAAQVGQDATTVSRRIRRLEGQLQARLFETGATGRVLSEQGRSLLVRAEAMEREALGIVGDRGFAAAGVAGAIRLSVSEGFGSHVLAPRLPAFTRAFPAVTVDLIATSGFLNPSRREADLAVMLSRPKAGPLVVRKLTDYRLGLYGARALGGELAAIGEPADLIGRPLVGYVPDLLYAPELDYLAEVDPRLRASVRSSSINAQAALVGHGAGVGVLPCFVADRMPRLVRLLPERVAITRGFWLVVHRDARRIARIERFIEWLDSTVADAAPLLAGDQRPA